MTDVLETLRRRYGELDLEVPLDRLILKQSRNRARRAVIDQQLAELSAERQRLEMEDARLELAKRTLVEDTAERIRQSRGEGWSPTPVLGYRVWAILEGRVVGATGRPWSSAEMVATCDRARRDDDLPHTDHMCSTYGYGCGIYAATHPGTLASADDSWIIGIVLLSGKVVEHERGYRAGKARVAAVVAQQEGRMIATVDMARIDALFEDPDRTIRELGEHIGRTLYGRELLEVLEDLEREMDRWT